MLDNALPRVTGFVRYAWFVVAYTVGVILWGAVVRATGSGAGCGNHWPACNGEIIPRADNIETLIEFSHRLTSGFSGILILVLLIWAFRLKPARKFVRRMALLSFIFVVIEGGIGAALVRLELVEDNASTLRAVAIGLHLVNTLILLAWIALTAWGAQQQRPIKIVADTRTRLMLLVAIVGFSIMSAAGAVTALGDTLFLSGVIGNEPDGAQHFLISLRAWHPILAVAVSAYLFVMGFYLQRRTTSARLEMQITWLYMIVAAQIGLGILNIFLQAPVWMQVTHLLVADGMWLLLIVITGNVLIAQPQEKLKRADADDPQMSLAAGD